MCIRDSYKRIEAIQFTMSHDDGKKLEDIKKADIVLLGVSRTSKTPTSMYLANRGFKTANIPLVMDQNIPEELKSKSNKTCVVGLVTDPERLADVRRNRVTMMKENNIKEYTDLNFIKEEINKSKNQNIPANIIIEFARIYGFQVDFQRDIRKNDNFQIMYETFLDTDSNV